MKHFIEFFFRMILVISVVLMTFFSLIILIMIHLSMFKQPFSFTLEGFHYYLNAIAQYKGLFMFTITVIAAYNGLQAWRTASINQEDRLKQDRFVEWKAALEYRFEYTDKNDPLIRKIFTTERWKIFTELYKLDLKIENKEQLNHFFLTIFKKLVITMEEQNIRYKSHHSIYPQEDYVYCFESLRWIILGCLQDYYDDIEMDLKKLMQEYLPMNRKIDHEKWEEFEMVEGVNVNNTPCIEKSTFDEAR